MANISAIKLPDDTNYNIKAVAIPKGKLDTTSTATVMTASIDGITELVDGVCVWLTNGVITSATNFTININGLGAKPVYSSQAAATRSSTIFNVNYTALLIYNEDRVTGGCWDYVYGYDSNTNTIGYQIRTQAVSMPMDSITYRYRLLFQSVDGKKLVPANNSTSTNATSSRTTIQTPIDPFGLIFYYGTTASVAAGSKPNSSYLWQQYNGISLGYSFNTTGAALTMTTSAPIYLKCAPQTNGSAIIDSTTPFVQSLPSSEDGKIYIFLGIAESATAFMLTLEHPIYWYKDGMVRQWTNSEVDKVDQTSATASSYSYWRPLLVGSSADANPGFTPTTVTGKTFTFPTLQVQPSTGTYRGSNVDFVSGNYKATLSATTLTANRALTLPDKGGMLARTSDIPSASDATPQALGTAAAGSSSDYSRADHVHALPTYSKSDVGLGNVDNVQQYSASNPPPYPVTSVNGSTGAVTLTIPTKVSDLTNDSGFITGMYIASYGNSTYADILAAYQAKKIVYCRASSDSDPSSGEQRRLAFLAYVNYDTAPTEFEFQYYRSVATHTDAQQGDQVFVYKLNSSTGWSFTTREAYTKINTGTGLSKSYSNGTLTISNSQPALPTPTASDNGKFVAVVNGAYALANLPTYQGGVS